MADTPAPSKKSSFVKVAIGLVLAMAGYGGADAAGYSFDPTGLKDWGAVAACAYLEWRIRPLLVQLIELWRGKPIEGQLLEVEAVPVAPPAPEPVTGRIPRLAVARPASVTDE